MTLSRTELRELCMKMVFQYNFYPNPDLDEAVWCFLETNERLTDEDRKEVFERGKDIFSHVAEIDAEINEKAKDWTTERMGRVDLSLIRLAVYEMKYDEETPDKVAVNEAVNLAKKYGGDNSPKFVNGVLHHFVKENG